MPRLGLVGLQLWQTRFEHIIFFTMLYALYSSVQKPDHCTVVLA